MKSKTIFGTVLGILLLFCVSMAINVFSSFLMVKAASDDYQTVVDEDGNFAGIGLNTEWGNAFRVTIKEDMLADNSVLGGAVSFVLDSPIDVGNTTGFAIKLKAKKDVSFLMYAQDDQGDYYRMFTGTSTDYNFIEDDGDIYTLKNSTLTDGFSLSAGQAGTLNFDWSKGQFLGITKSLTEGFTGVHIAKIIIGFNMRTDKYAGSSLDVSSIADYTVTGADMATANIVLETSKLTYAEDGQADAQVNLSDITKGSKIKSEVCFGTSNQVYDSSSSQVQNSVANLIYSRHGFIQTINYIDTDGNTIAEQEQTELPGGPYSITPKTIEGYTFTSEKNGTPLQGEMTEDLSFTLIYELNVSEFQIKIDYLNIDGQVIRESDVKTYDAGSHYQIEPPAIDGYKFVESANALEGTVTGDLQIYLIYNKVPTEALNYSIIKDDEQFVGIKIDNAMGGAFQFSLKGAADIQTTTSGLGVMTFKLDIPVQVSETSGLAIQLQGLSLTSYFRTFLIDSEGNLYRTADGNPRLDVFISDEGEISELPMNDSSWFQGLPANSSGTWYLKWDNVYSVSGGTVVSGDPVNTASENIFITEVLIAREMRVTNAHAGTGFVVGTIAAVDEETETAFEVLDTAKLSYKSDGADDTCDVNLTDISKGLKIYSDSVITGSFVLKGMDDPDTIISLDNWIVERKGFVITLNYVDEEGDALKVSEEINVPYAGDSANYEVEAAQIVGYEFYNSDFPLSGTITQDMEINLVYKRCSYAITLLFVDEDGNTIKESEVEYYLYREIYDLTADDIEGYEFMQSSSSLRATAVRDMTITLTYRKIDNGGGCNGSIGGSAAIFFVVAVGISGLFMIGGKKHSAG